MLSAGVVAWVLRQAMLHARDCAEGCCMLEVCAEACCMLEITGFRVVFSQAGLHRGLLS